MNPGPSRRAFMAQLTAGATLAATANAQPAAAIDTLGPGRAPDDDAYWRAVRAQFLIPPDIGYMNTGSRGPSPRSVIAAQFAAINAYDSDRLSYLRNVASVEARELVRARMAEFVGCQPHEIAITTNTTEGMSIGTAGLDMQPGDEIIYTNHDHSSGAQPINLRAARYGIVPIIVDLSDKRFHPPATPEATLAAIEAAITKRTKLISFCHINYTDGCVMPVKEICALARDKGIATLVDGAHPPGMLQLDVHELGCDMYAGACHKWMLASMQTGFFFVREELLDRVWPLNYSGPVAGKSMYGEPYPPGSTLERSQTAAKFEMHGSGNFASYASVPAALDFHTTLTPQAIEARVRHMAARVRASLRDIPGVRVHVSEDPRMCAGLVSFNVGDVDPTTVNDTLWDRHRIYIRAVTHAEIGWSANRASLHVMVHDGDVDNFLGAIAELAKEHHV